MNKIDPKDIPDRIALSKVLNEMQDNILMVSKLVVKLDEEIEKIKVCTCDTKKPKKKTKVKDKKDDK